MKLQSKIPDFEIQDARKILKYVKLPMICSVALYCIQKGSKYTFDFPALIPNRNGIDGNFILMFNFVYSVKTERITVAITVIFVVTIISNHLPLMCIPWWLVGHINLLSHNYSGCEQSKHQFSKSTSFLLWSRYLFQLSFSLLQKMISWVLGWPSVFSSKEGSTREYRQ